MARTPSTRRSFFGVAGGVALLCTIGGRGGRRLRARRAHGGRCGRRARPPPARRRRPGRAADPAGAGRDPARVLDPGRDRALGDHAAAPRRVAQPPALGPQRRSPRTSTALMTPGFAGYVTRSDDPRPDADRRGRRRARRALPQRRPQARPGGHDAPARRQVQPGVRRRLHGRVHARGRVHRARRDLHLPVGVHAGIGRRLAVPRPRAQPHAQHVPRAVRRDHRPPEGREAARPRLHAVRPPAPAAGHPPGGQLPLHQRPRLRGQHADADRARRRGRRDPRVRHGLQLPHVPHPRPPLEGPGGGVHRQPGDGAERDASRPASSRTTRVAGSTTATSSPTRTWGWRAGTWSTPETRGEVMRILLAARRPGGRAARARRRERTDVPRAEGARARSRPSPRARTRPTPSARRRALRLHGRSRRPSTRRAPATRSACATASTARP